jgi:diketogulonate reductase-like aldo/keto reductase
MSMNRASDAFTLGNNYKIPCLGLGTWQIPDGNTAVIAVRKALETGYRHIDAAAIYGNEAGVGRGIAESGLNRADLFVTSKVWNEERGYEKTRLAFEKSLSDLQLDYLDLYLIHWPASASRFDDWEHINLETWRAMTELYKMGRIRAIGVSNFLPHHLDALMHTEVQPVVNQIEFHPGHMQKETVQYCKLNSILVEAWSPLGTGEMLSNLFLAGIARKYQKSVAQLCIRWCLQNNTLPLPKSMTPSHIKENAEVFDFTISEEDMAAINGMQYFGGLGLHPDQIDF